ncbi:hypothetical protein [Pectinatus frisingensis]|uniref:hypothetical protein n=1 Tax=Pectinatus frisingensis TaxID=865 RepID=UPI0015F64F15|nr:hypothetical protein [Pectinatus frisingensis]
MAEQCPICGSELKKDLILEDGLSYFCCYNCGLYSCNSDLKNVLQHNESINTHYKDINANEKLKMALFYYLRVIRHNYKPSFGIHSSIDISQNFSIQSPDTISNIYNLYPKTFSRKIDMVMELINTKIENIGDHFSLLDYSNINYNFVLAQNYEKKEQIDGMFNILKKMVFLDGEQKYFTFTPKGWEKIDSLQRYKKSKTAFIAMSFDWENKKFPIKECKDLIKKAVIKAGYEPCIISEHQHNKSIPQEIENEIKKASFVITDLTTQNKGAYYEAGVAKGLGKEVIFTCHEGVVKYFV